MTKIIELVRGGPLQRGSKDHEVLKIGKQYATFRRYAVEGQR